VAEANIFDTDFVYDDGDPDGYHSGDARVGEAAGGKALAVRVFEVPAGQGVCPYHYEYEEEWLVVLEGSVDLRTPAGTRALERGDIVCFPPGPAGAHQVKTQTGAPTARVMMFSSAREPAVAVYPDSDKIGVWPGNKDDDGLFRRADGDVGYWDGEGT
jgi:uncharacterized cupin superfamily protein